MADDQTKTDNRIKLANMKSEIGSMGLNQYGGFIMEEQLPELQGDRWRRVVRDLIKNEATVGAGLFAIEMLIRQVEWAVMPADDSPEAHKLRDFIDGALFRDMSQPWPDTLAEIATMIAWGFSFFEQVYKERRGDSADPAQRSMFSDGLIGWRKWAIRAQDTVWRWEFDDEGGIQGLVQSAPPSFTPVFIPIEKALLFRPSAHKNNPEGQSVLRRAWRACKFKQRIENIEGVGIERDLAGFPLGKMPAKYMDENATPAEKALYSLFKKIVIGIKRDEQEGAIIPSDVDPKTQKPLFDLTLLSTGGQRQFDTNTIIQRWDQRILMTMLADVIMLGHEKVGSFALASSKTDLLSVALGAWLDSIAEVINRHAIPRLLRLNGMDTKIAPSLKHGDVETVDITELAAFVTAMTGAGVAFDQEQRNYMLKQAGFPIAESNDADPDAPENDTANPGTTDAAKKEAGTSGTDADQTAAGKTTPGQSKQPDQSKKDERAA